jgi:hypothetical protein
LKRLKLAIFTSLSLDIALVVLLGLEIHLQLYRMSSILFLSPSTANRSPSSAYPREPHPSPGFASSGLACFPSATARPTARLSAFAPCGLFTRHQG